MLNSKSKSGETIASSSADPYVYSISKQLSSSQTGVDVNTAESTNNLILPSPSILPNSPSTVLPATDANFLSPKLSSKKSVSRRQTCFNRPKIVIPLLLLGILFSVGVTAGVVYAIVTAKFNNDNLAKSTLSPDIIIPSSTGSILSSSSKNPDDKTNSANNNKTCGVQKYPPNLQLTRIMKGFPALEHSWPWTVSIGYYGPRTTLPHACGGSLVNKRYVVTATHCVQSSSIFSLVGNPVKDSEQYGSLEKMMRIYVGVTTRSTDIHTNNTYRVEEVIMYPDFDSSTFKNDISIIKLNRDVEETEELSYICISNQTITEPGTDLYAVGWGFSDNNFYRASDTLNQVKFQVQTEGNCGLVYLPMLQFCAGNPKLGKDTCNGDSGGPVMQLDKSNRWSLVGVVSNGDAMCTGRGIYTNVSYFSSWISEKTKLI